jgi:hypothetical protein
VTVVALVLDIVSVLIMLAGLALAVAVIVVVLRRGDLLQVYIGTIAAIALVEAGRRLLTRNYPDRPA